MVYSRVGPMGYSGADYGILWGGLWDTLGWTEGVREGRIENGVRTRDPTYQLEPFQFPPCTPSKEGVVMSLFRRFVSEFESFKESGSQGKYREFLVSVGTTSVGDLGYFDKENKSIVLSDELIGDEVDWILAHEMAHAFLDDEGYCFPPCNNKNGYEYAVQEVEILCDYLALLASGAPTPEFGDSQLDLAYDIMCQRVLALWCNEQ